MASLSQSSVEGIVKYLLVFLYVASVDEVVVVVAETVAGAVIVQLIVVTVEVSSP